MDIPSRSVIHTSIGLSSRGDIKRDRTQSMITGVPVEESNNRLFSSVKNRASRSPIVLSQVWMI